MPIRLSSRPWHRLAALAVACLLMVRPSADTVEAQRGAPPLADATDLAVGKLLVAKRGLVDPNFRETVVLLLSYSLRDGAAGLIINRASPTPARTLIPGFPRLRSADSTVFLGGPVFDDDVTGLIRLPHLGLAPPRVLPDVGFLAGGDAIQAAVDEGASAERLRVYQGYAGWAPGQLEREVQRGDWYVTRGDSQTIFAPDTGTVWRVLMRRLDVMAV